MNKWNPGSKFRGLKHVKHPDGNSRKAIETAEIFTLGLIKRNLICSKVCTDHLEYWSSSNLGGTEIPCQVVNPILMPGYIANKIFY